MLFLLRLLHIGFGDLQSVAIADERLEDDPDAGGHAVEARGPPGLFEGRKREELSGVAGGGGEGAGGVDHDS